MKLLQLLTSLKESPGARNSLGVLVGALVTLVAVSPSTEIVPFLIVALLVVAVALFSSAEGQERFEAYATDSRQRFDEYAAESRARFDTYAASIVQEVAAGSLLGHLGRDENNHNFSLFLCSDFSSAAMADVHQLGERFDGILVFHDIRLPTPESHDAISRMPLLEAGQLTKLVWEHSGFSRIALYSPEADHWAILPRQPTVTAIGRYLRDFKDEHVPWQPVTDYEWVCEILLREIAEVRPIQDIASFGKVETRGKDSIRRTQRDLTAYTDDIMAIDNTPPGVWLGELRELFALNIGIARHKEGSVRRIFVEEDLRLLPTERMEEFAVLLQLHEDYGLRVGLAPRAAIRQPLHPDQVIYHRSMLFRQDSEDEHRGAFYAARTPVGRVSKATQMFEDLWDDRELAVELRAKEWRDEWLISLRGQAKREDEYWARVVDLKSDLETRVPAPSDQQSSTLVAYRRLDPN